MLDNDLTEKEYVYREIEKKNTKDVTFAIIVKSNKQIAEWSDFLTEK
ncbi:MAG: hypothetical protein P1U46_04855 [Patescibacteria group bacterium]|nr:hypothetical protein [Patescibacteria group bacterium]